MTEKEFHAARQMFFVRCGILIIVPSGVTGSHIETLYRLVGDQAPSWIATATRGYVLGDKLVAYVGQDFSHRVDLHDVMIALEAFSKWHRLATVCLGAVYSATEMPWPAKVEYTVEEFCQKLGAVKSHLGK